MSAAGFPDTGLEAPNRWSCVGSAGPGFKSSKFVTTLFVTSRRPPSFREDRGYNWFSGL